MTNLTEEQVEEKDITVTKTSPSICSKCHYSLLPEFYFCPNCGEKIIILSTGVWAQTKLYMHSIILPFLCYLTISKWYGIRYVRSDNTKTKIVGMVAIVLLLSSTVFVIWYSIYITEQFLSSASSNINSLMGEQ